MKQIFSFVSITILLIAFGLKLSAQQDCANAVEITSLPYSATELSTTGMLNNYSSENACNSTAMDNEEYVFSFTPSEDMQINIELLNTALTPSGVELAAKIGLFITEGCPDVGTCIASIDTEASNPALSDIELTAETTYYIVVSSSSVTLFAPETNVDFDINITKNALNDVGVTEITEIASSCDLGSTSIECTIENYGLNDATGFSISYSINGQAPVDETFSATITAGSTETYTFTTDANLSDIDEYNIKVYTSLADDENPNNDETVIDITHYPTISSFPSTEDFESSHGFWSTGGTSSSWVHGNPDELLPDLVINSASSGDNIWVTNLAGNTNTSEVSYIESPCYNLSSLSFPTIELYAWVNFPLIGNSSGNIKASIDGGSTWTVDVYTFATTTEWEHISTMLPTLAGQTNVKFRINYSSGVLAANGIGIDDFTIKEAVLTDVGITDIPKPFTSCGLSDSQIITIEITNFGAEEISDIVVDYSIDSGITWLSSTETVSTTIQPNETHLYNFIADCDLSSYGNYDIVAKTVQPGDEDNTNDEYLKTVSSQQTIAATDYVESFESGNGGWYTYGTNSTMELAMPANTLINSAGDGDYAWVSNATGFCNSNEVSYLESPCFDFTGLTNPKIKAMIQYETTQMLSNFSLEYTTDDGFQWDTVSAGLSSDNWYGTDLIAFGTWSGSSAGWLVTSTDIPQVVDQASVKFRFVFNNGGLPISTGDTEGVAIDLISIFDCTNMPTASFTYNVEGTTVTFTNESENGTSYSWNFGDNQLMPSTSTEENPSFTYTMDGSYVVSLTVTNECSSVTYSTTIDISTSICETNISSGIYPNPASSQLFINLENASEFSYQIINISGQLIQSGTSIDNGTGININEMSSGVYFIKIETANESFINQFIKE